MSSNEPLPIQIKARKDGLILIPHSDATFESIYRFTAERLEESRDFFHRTAMILDLREKPLRTDEIISLRSLLQEKAGAAITEVLLADGCSLFPNRNHHRSVPTPRSAPTVVPEPVPTIVRSTCRSGTRIESGSDCIILGDVNPGAEVLAVGDVIVFGNLRGIAHAGAAGNRGAKIWALSIEPSQIRIADLVALPPKGGTKPIPKRYEIAEIQGDLIEVITL
ncbi:MAG: septum site-determining protein MinC [Syntrophobacteraceae bacterium]|nr:septum site-determining protein MinC [Syntrophobacteraceae bacterium]